MTKARSSAAVPTIVLISLVLTACGQEEQRSLVEMELTYYWIAAPLAGDGGEAVPLLDLEGIEIARVPETFARRVAMEGTGRLLDGRLVNISNAEPWPGSRFMLVDTGVAPHGLDARGEPLVPFVTVAVDPEVVPLGATLYAPTLAGFALPDGTTHDGRLRAGDTGYTISGHHLDLFTGTHAFYQELDLALGERTTIEVEIRAGPDPH